jgi:ABC-type nickel/cobalt efflux system permease component RcnA
MEKVKKQAKQLTESTKRVISGVEEFVIGAAVVITAGYNYYDLSIRPVGNVEYVVRLASSVIVALAGAWLLARHFNNRAK